MNEEEIFHEALARAAPADRAVYLDGACAGDPARRAAVEALLRASVGATGFLECPAATLDEPARDRPGTVIGPYKLLEQIGEGGFGVVFMAEQTEPVRRKVALKILKPGMDTRQVVARFEAERQALALMDHPHIARVFDGGATPTGRPYFVMELVKGVPITAYCDRHQLTPRQRLALFVGACQAVQHAHQKGIIHRDLKPSNVLVTVHDTAPVVKVIDFGIAKPLGQDLTDKTLFTGFAQMVGTPLYMSPEQAGQSGLDVDTRSDIYSLGVLLYELLTGTTPFDKRRFKQAACDEIRRIIREEDPPRPSTRLSESKDALPAVAAQRHMEPAKLTRLVRGELDWIVMKAMEKDRNRRYESASAFATDVQRYLTDEPVLACPPSAAYRFGKFARRNKTTLVTLTVLGLAAIVAAGSLVVSHARISAESGEKAKALAAAKASEQQALESLKDALAAVDQMLTRVSEERLQFLPQAEPLRRDLLQDALKFYEKFLARKGDNPAVRRETALAFRRLGTLYHRLGDYRKSEDAYRRAFAMLDDLDAEAPLDPGTRAELVLSHIWFSWALANQGKYDEQEKVLRRAVAIADGLRKDFPDVPLYRDHLVEAGNRLANEIAKTRPDEAEDLLLRNLSHTEGTDSYWYRGQTYQFLGALRGKQNRLGEAEDAGRQAVGLFEKALAKWPERVWMKGDLATTLTDLARTLEATGRLQQAEQILSRALPMLDQFAADYPAGPHYRWGQSRAHLQQAELLKKLGRLDEAEQAYRRSLELSEKLADDFPDLPGYQWTALDRLRALAVFLIENGRATELEPFNEAGARRFERLTVAEKAKALQWRGHFYVRLGQWDKAAADLAKVIDLGSDDVSGVWYPRAVLLLRAGRTAEYRGLCERLLERPALVQKGKHFVVIICKLAPDAVADLSRPVQIAEELVSGQPSNAEYLGLLGAALYRRGDPARGDLEAAVGKLEAGIRASPKQIGVHWRKLVLAMAYQRLGRGADAQPLFQEVTRWMETAKLTWAQRLDLELLHREAEEVLKHGAGVKTREAGQTESSAADCGDGS
jgi:serine/threonine protein kinase